MFKTDTENVKSDNFGYRKVGRAITIFGAIVKNVQNII